MSEDKKTRRHWLFDKVKNVVSTTDSIFDLSKMTESAIHFLMLYGLKQYLADCLAVSKPIVLTPVEIKERLTNRFSNLCSDKFKLTITDSGYYWKDPNAVAISRKPSVTLDTIYNGLIEDGKTPKDATAKVTLWTGKPYFPK